MKYRTTRTQGRTEALFLALNWFLTDQYDKSQIDRYIEEARTSARYTTDEVSAYLARRYVGRFRTSRLRKKHSDDLYWLGQSRVLARTEEKSRSER